MLAFEGEMPTPEIEEILRTREVGGFTIFRKLNVNTPAQIRELTTRLQKINQAAGHPPLLIAADQEGGQLIGLGNDTTLFPGNMALGAANDLKLVDRVGYAIGCELLAMGVNINYAPVCDINSNPLNPNIGVRAFGDDPAQVSAMSAAMVVGIQRAGVASAAKHFPGSGEVSVDSHYAIPVLDFDLQRLQDVEFAPFKAAIDAGVKMIMSAHVALPALNGQPELPATLSRQIMYDLLRKQMGFEGLVISDALDMEAITQGAGQIIEMIAAIRAGIDLLLLKPDAEARTSIYDGLALAISRKLIAPENLEESIQRVFALKNWISKAQQPALDVVSSVEHNQLAHEVAEKSITLVRDDLGVLPIKLKSEQRIALFIPKPTDLTPADTSSYTTVNLIHAVRAYHEQADEYIYSQRPTGSDIAALTEQARKYDLVLVGTISAHTQPEQAFFVKQLMALDIPVITIALRTPYDLLAYPNAPTHICTYSILPASMTALAAALWGKTTFSGQLPVQLKGLYERGHSLIK